MRAFFAKTIPIIKRAKAALFCIKPLVGIRFTFFVAVIALGVLAVAHPAFADGTGSVGGDIADWLVIGVTDILLTTARLAIGICIFFLHLFITLASYNNYINTPVVQVGWIMVRDVANMFFVVTLLVIAFGTILGLEQYEWKKGLVKLILGAIFINFSNLLAQLIIDVAHVFTITFLNAIAAAAGGNLLQMFHLTEILSFIQKSNSSDVSNVRLELLGGAIMAVVFAIFAAVAMGAYVVAIMARVVLLWVLIIMSPLAFIWQVLPATQGYAERWWKEFKEQVLVAPIMVFFLWLTFATLGTGTVIRDIQNGEDGKSSVIPLQNEASDEVAVSISKVSSWERMASFLVAIAFLFIGIKEVGETGAVGSRIIGNAVDFGKKVATVATGFGAAKFLAGKGTSAIGTAVMAPLKGAGWLAKQGAWHVAGKHIVNKAKTTKAAYLDWYYKQGGKMTNEGQRLKADAGKKTEDLVKKKDLASKETDETKKVQLELEATELEAQIADLEQKMQKEFAGGVFGSSARRGIQYEKQLAKTEKQMENSKKLLWKSVGSEAGGKVAFGMGIGTGTRGIGFVPFQERMEKSLDKSAGERKKEIADIDKQTDDLTVSRDAKLANGDKVGFAADQKKIEDLDKRKKKLEGQMGRRKAVGSAIKFFRLGGDQYELDEDLAKEVYGEKGVTAKDRVERGWLKAEEARSAAKDEEFESLGERQALNRPRFKYDVKNGKFGWQATKGGMADQIAQHKVGAETHQKAIEARNSQARMKVVAEFDARTTQGDTLVTKEMEEEQNLLAAESMSESSLEKRAAELRSRLGGVDTEREEKEKALKTAKEDAEKKSVERGKKEKTLDAIIASEGTESENGKKAIAEKANLQAEAAKELEKIEGIETHIAGLVDERKRILGNEDEPGSLAALEREFKELEGIIAGGDDKVKETLGDIDKDLLAKKEKVKAADTALAPLEERRRAAEAVLTPQRKDEIARIESEIEKQKQIFENSETTDGARKKAKEALGSVESGLGLYKELKDAEAPIQAAQEEKEEIKKEEDPIKKEKEANQNRIQQLERKKGVLDMYLENEFKDFESILAGGEGMIKNKLGQIDADIAGEKKKMEEVDAKLDGKNADIAKRRNKAQFELDTAQASPEENAKLALFNETIKKLERKMKEGHDADPTDFAAQKESIKARKQLYGDESIKLADGTQYKGDLYDAVKNSPANKAEEELKGIKKEEETINETAKQEKEASEKHIRQQERKKGALEKKKKEEVDWSSWYNTEIGGMKDRISGVDDEKVKKQLAVVEGQLTQVQGGDSRKIQAQIEELKKKDGDPESDTKREELEKQLASIKNPDDVAKAERAKRLEKVKAEAVAPVKAELAKIKAQKADLKKEAIKLPSGVTYDDFLHNKSEAGHLAHILEQDEDRLFHAFEQKEYKSSLGLNEMSNEVGRGKFDPKSKKLEAEKKTLQAQFDERRSKGTVGILDQERLALEKQHKDATEELANIERPLKQIEAEIKKMEELEKKLTDELENPKGIEPDRKEELEGVLKNLNKEKDDKNIELAKVAGADDKERDKVKARREELATTIKTKDDEIVKVGTKIKAAEKDMRKTDPAYVRLDRQLKEKNKEIDQIRDENWKKKGERLLNGDKSVVTEVVRDINRQIEEAKKAGDGQEVQRLGKEKSKWEKLSSGHHLKDASLAWRYGVSKAKQEDVAKGYKYQHNLLLSESEQRAVYDKRGLDTPKTTLTELIEQYGKSFGEMSIDSFTANVGPMLTSMLEKKKAGTLTAQDKAALMGLFKRGLDRSWLDDAIYAIRGDEKAKTMIADELGWEDNVYTDDKIRDIQMLFATADVDFVKKNATMSYFQDVGYNEYEGMKQEDIFEGVRTGVFKDKTGKNITAEFKAKVGNLMERNHFKPTPEQDELFKSIFASLETSDQSKLDEMQKLRTKSLNEYLETTRQNQSEFQFLGNLRTDALKNGHVENAGYALARDIGGGESLYMGMGVRTARGHVMGDARKMDLRNRAGMQSHSFGYLDENNGQVMTDIHEDKYGDLMNGIDPRTYNAVNPRARVHMMGLSSSDKFGNYRDEKDNSFHVSRMVNRDGTLTNAAKTWSTVLANDETYSKDWNGAKTKDEQEKVMAAAQMNRIFAPQMRGNVSSFVMLAAEAAGLNPTSAAMDGKINFKIFNPRRGNVAYKRINELIGDYNKGDWNLGGKMPPKLIPSFIETDPASRKNVKDQMEDNF